MFTKGPWHIKDENRIVGGSPDNTLWLLSEQDEPIAFTHDQNDQDRENFKLMAAVPDMYEALQAWMVYLKDPNCGWLSKAQYLTTKALAKAEGRQA